MKKGIVLEVHDDYVTMLTPDGEFLKSRKQKGQVDIGEEIIFFPLHRGAAEKRKLASFFKMKWAIVTMLTVAVLFLSFYPKYVNNQIYAYVSLDVNPSLELGLNKNMQVVSIDAFNEEAKLLLPRLEDWKNEDLSKVSSEIMILFQQDGYLKSGGEVVIATVLADSENLVWKKKMQNELFSISQNIQGENVSVTTLETTSEKRDEAIKQGVSPGKYLQNERKTELVDKDDTSKTTGVKEDLQVVPSKVTDVEQLQVKTEKEKQETPDAVRSKEWKDPEGKQERTHKHDEIKEQRKENHDKRKEENKEYREQVTEEKKDHREERKQELEQKREERKDEQNQRKEDRKNECGQNKNGHHNRDKERH